MPRPFKTKYSMAELLRQREELKRSDQPHTKDLNRLNAAISRIRKQQRLEQASQEPAAFIQYLQLELENAHAQLHQKNLQMNQLLTVIETKNAELQSKEQAIEALNESIDFSFMMD